MAKCLRIRPLRSSNPSSIGAAQLFSTVVIEVAFQWNQPSTAVIYTRVALFSLLAFRKANKHLTNTIKSWETPAQDIGELAIVTGRLLTVRNWSRKKRYDMGEMWWSCEILQRKEAREEYGGRES